ncbi:hypothetical protein AVEN_176763-1, partial [Araneus ventricosus]
MSDESLAVFDWGPERLRRQGISIDQFKKVLPHLDWEVKTRLRPNIAVSKVALIGQPTVGRNTLGCRFERIDDEASIEEVPARSSRDYSVYRLYRTPRFRQPISVNLRILIFDFWWEGPSPPDYIANCNDYCALVYCCENNTQRREIRAFFTAELPRIQRNYLVPFPPYLIVGTKSDLREGLQLDPVLFTEEEGHLLARR